MNNTTIRNNNTIKNIRKNNIIKNNILKDVRNNAIINNNRTNTKSSKKIGILVCFILLMILALLMVYVNFFTKLSWIYIDAEVINKKCETKTIRNNFGNIEEPLCDYDIRYIVDGKIIEKKLKDKYDYLEQYKWEVNNDNNTNIVVNNDMDINNYNNYFNKKGIKPHITIKYNRWNPEEILILNYDNFYEDFMIGDMLINKKKLINISLYVIYVIILIVIIILIINY